MATMHLAYFVLPFIHIRSRVNFKFIPPVMVRDHNYPLFSRCTLTRLHWTTTPRLTIFFATREKKYGKEESHAGSFIFVLSIASPSSINLNRSKCFERRYTNPSGINLSRGILPLCLNPVVSK